MKLTAVFLKVPEGYIGFVEELPGANTQGKTLQEARDNIREAIELTLEANRTLAEESLAKTENVIRDLSTCRHEAQQPYHPCQSQSAESICGPRHRELNRFIARNICTDLQPDLGPAASPTGASRRPDGSGRYREDPDRVMYTTMDRWTPERYER